MDIGLLRFMRDQVDHVSTSFHRYLYDRVDWGRRMLGIVGPRGVGKTTLFLQYIKEHEKSEKAFYVSADNIWFSVHSLLELADEFSREGGEYLFIDEIHKYNGWSSELKQIYDGYSDLKVAFTGSSVLDIVEGTADLSRRAPIYHMQGLSFREYLAMFEDMEFKPCSIGDIVGLKVDTPSLRHPLPYFKEYLQRGYYPFGNDPEFFILLNQIVNLTLEVDIPQYANMSPSTVKKMKRLLAIIAKSVPFKPVMDQLSGELGVSRNTLPDYFLYMEKAGLIAQVRDSPGGFRGLGKVEKVYLDNPSMAYVLGNGDSNIGNIRETFFYNQLRVNNDVITSKISDFEIGGRTFEIGGRKKGKRQIAEAAEGYVIRDDIEYGSDNVIPLWLFGFNY